MLGAGAVVLAAAIVALVAMGSHESSRTAAAAATSDVLATIDPATNRITQRFPVGDTPTVVTVGAGAAWTINADGRTVSRVDLRTHAVTTIAPGTIPLDIVAGEDAPWLVSAHDPRAGTLDYPTPDTLARLDPVSGAPDRSLSLLPRQGHGYGGSKQSVAVGGDAVWTIGPTGWLHRVDLRSPDSSILRRLVAVAVATGDGQVWVLVEPPSDKPHAANLLRLRLPLGQGHCAPQGAVGLLGHDRGRCRSGVADRRLRRRRLARRSAPALGSAHHRRRPGGRRHRRRPRCGVDDQ